MAPALRFRSQAVRPSALLAILASLGLVAPAWAGTLAVVETLPVGNTMAPRSTAISVTFDRAVEPASIDHDSFRVFGKWSGAAQGTFSFSDGDTRVTFQPTGPFSAGEVVLVNLSHDIVAIDSSPLRAAGYAFAFVPQSNPSSRTFTQIDVMSNRSGSQTRIYGACASDLNEDGYLDLTTVNEVSSDIRVFLNRADGSGLYDDFLDPQPIGVEASPNDPADFNNDGHADLCIDATISGSVWVLLGAGDGTFYSTQEIPVGSNPHGITTLDVDGDGDLDIVNANNGSNNLSLLRNDGTGTFGVPSFFDSGVNGEYGLAAADMNRDGIMDVLVGGQQGQQIRTLLGNGDGTFTPAGPAQSSGGFTWVVTVGDLDGDGDIDASCANSASNGGSILLNNGDGTFGTPTFMSTGAHTPSTDLADLDGDGDMDWVLSCYGGGFWRAYTNDGAGHFTFDQEFPAPSNPSCSVPLDFDNDGDVDLALTDEIADVIVLMRNDQPASVPVPSAVLASSFEPNPVRDGARLRFQLPVVADLHLEIYDATGRRSYTRSWNRYPAGPAELELRGKDLASLPAGLYLYRLTAGAWRSEGRFTIAR
ncbi:MAG: FG-GAP-like repeat-containing protein [Candidatus Eisenbacteria bacterium]